MIKTQPVYNPLYTTKKFITLVTGGRGSAKSFNVSTFAERLSFERDQIMLYSRYTMTSASLSIIPEFQEKIDLDHTGKYFNVNKDIISNTLSDSKIIFKGIKTSSGNQTANLKSITGLNVFIGDEMEEWTSEEDYDTLTLSIRQKGKQNRVILILNPTDADHFIYKKYIENSHRIEYIDGVGVQISTHPEVEHIHTTYLDNLENLSEQFLDEVERIKKENPNKYAYKIIGKWADIAEGAIFDNWEEGEFTQWVQPYCYGQDYGFSVDPDTLIKVGIDRRTKTIYVDEKYYAAKQLGTDDLYNINRAYIDRQNDLIVADSAEDRLIEDLRKKGLNIIECEKGPGSVVAGITAMKDYKIVVTPTSFNVKKELRNYKWNDKKAGIPIDRYNHAIDSIRYAFRKLEGYDPNSRQKTARALGSMRRR